MSRKPVPETCVAARSAVPARLLACLVVLLTATAADIRPLGAQEGWDPFSQLETNRWERRSKRKATPPAQAEPAPVLAPAAAPSAADEEPGTAAAEDTAARDAYLAPMTRQPEPGERPLTYYPPGNARPPSDPQGPASAAPYPPPQGGYSSPRATPPDARMPPVPPQPAADRRGAPAAAQPAPGLPAPQSPSTTRRTSPANGGTPPTPGTPPAPTTTLATPAAPGGIVRGELQPVMSTDGSALPYELWRGLDLATLERLIATLTIPPRSPALHDLWRRLIVADVQAPAGAPGNADFEALRLEAVYRSGLIADIREALAARPPTEMAPLAAMMQARSEIALGRREAACDAARRITDIKGEIPRPLSGEAILVAGYCAAASGNKPAAGLLAELAREEGIKPSPGLAALDAVALGVKTDLSIPDKQPLSLVDYRILELGGATPPAADLIRAATPSLLVAVADDAAAGEDLRLETAEAAARINAYPPRALATLYRSIAGKAAATEATAPAATASGGTPATGPADPPRRRALLFATAAAERTPFKKVRAIRAFLDSARRAGLYFQALVMSAVLTDDIGLAPEIGWFAETAVEANLAAANYERARMWMNFAASLDIGRGGAGAGGAGAIDHWRALSDIADPDYPGARGDSLQTVEKLALSGRFGSDLLHRLATVLDALEYNVPIPLWEAASRTPQPATGHLPPTGTLSELQDAARKKEFGRTVLLAMQALGPDGGDGAHMIALGDAIRALRRAGLDKDARRLAFEALIAGWPRTFAN